ncbi:sugar phosphate nucleotidyltransferase [Ferroplasma acidiphilum]|nr:NDP-sugar synthase [Ferroplasma acidiphilum]MCL4349259.1 NDP-sugar synthase [Candidatus Thermoplasmatota archaeon]NOL61098.1 NDP-sugar synthase [Ferroplasma acidiphilum]WMT52922.1 MAG: NDP-sugar synthase [Ferroplasma acidiphilum]
MSIKAVVMAGGKGTRLRPITYSIPKPVVPIAGKPCMLYLLDSYYNAGIKDVIITTGYKFSSLITSIIENRHNDQAILFSVEKEPAGTAGSVKMVSNFIDDTLIVGSGDILSDFNISDIINFHKKNKAMVTIVLTEVEDPRQFGIVEMENNRIVRFLEKPDRDQTFSHIASTGIYVIEPEILDYITTMPYDFAKDLFPELMKRNIDIYGYMGKGVWLDTGRPNDLITANQIMVEKYGKLSDGDLIKGKNIILDMAGIHNTGIEKCYIGRNIKAGDNVHIKDSALYDNENIGNNVEITNSLLMDNVTVRENTKIRNSVIMRNCVIGENSEIVDSIIAPDMDLRGKSRIYNVSLASKVIEDEM